MNTSRGILLTTLFVLLRLTPIGAALTIITGTATLPPDRIAEIADLMVRLTLALIAWSMSEGTLMLWFRERASGSQVARGYGFVAIFFAVLVALTLLIFRAQCSQTAFLVLLGALSLRGITRASWEQGRPLTAVFTCIGAHTVLAALSFMLVLNDHLPWEGGIISLAIGTLVGAVEITWYADTLESIRNRWLLPVYRISLGLAPILIGMLALLGRLPQLYLAVYLIFVLTVKTLKQIRLDGRISAQRFGSVATIYVVFVGILIACRIYS